MKQRCISAFVLAFLCIPLFLIGGLPFTFFILFLAFLSLKELEDCIETKKELPFFMKFLTFLSVGLLFLFANYSYSFQFLSYPILAILFFLYFIPTIFYKNNTYTVLEAFLLVGIVLFLSFVFSFLIYLRRENISYFIYLLLISIFTDTYALLVGSLVGKHKLIPRISPNKTWEGAIGGSIFATFIASFYFRTFVNYDFPLVLLGVMTLFLSIIGQLGDLFFSAIKRYFKKKDFSQLIPGHGGILDRIDNFLFVALAFMALLAFL